MKKLLIFVVAMCISVLFLNTPVEGWNELGKARDSVEMGLYDNAFELLNGIIKKNPKNIEAHMLLGICYLATNNDPKADDRFRNVLRQDPSYGKRFATEYKQAAEIARDNNNLFRAKKLFTKAIQYDPALKAMAHSFFVSLGNRANGYRSVEFYELALNFTHNQKQKDEIGNKFLKLAYKDSRRRDILKRKAALVVGQDWVERIFPEPKTKVVFEKPYTFDDAFNESGQIYTFHFLKDGVRVGDQIEIIAQLKSGGDFTGREIEIWRGKDFKPKWAKTKEGYYVQRVAELPNNKFGISLKKRKDVIVTVRVTGLREEV